MAQDKPISGFSKFSSDEKVRWLSSAFNIPEEIATLLHSHLHQDAGTQEIYQEISENTLSNFYLPFGIAPNFMINKKWYAIPMVIEESSVVAAASHASKFWSERGGFNAEVLGTEKIGQVHFFWNGDASELRRIFEAKKTALQNSVLPMTSSMESRGGGIKAIRFVDMGEQMENLFHLKVTFQTADAMGANFINSVLETLARAWQEMVEKELENSDLKGSLEINMSILSNYTPESLVKVWVECPLEQLSTLDPEGSGKAFAEKFVRSVNISKADPYRAVTHNKGIFNGMDAVVLATGNDFRAVEACGHAFAARDGHYRGLSNASIEGGLFRFELTVAMSVGTVGGLTQNHPLAGASLQILQNPGAEELMMIIATAGLANNFSAVRSLVTTGIQKGHMKMHLNNILRQLNANDEEKESVQEFFKDKSITFTDIKAFLSKTRT